MASNNRRGINGESESDNGVKDLSRAKWSKQTLHVFCDLCIQFAENSKEKHSTPRMAWKVLQVEFQKKTNLPYAKNQLKNKWDWMKNRWNLWKAFKANETDLQWDHHKGTISATDHWWNLKIHQNLHFKSFRDEGIEPLLEAKMELLFGPSTSQHLDISRRHQCDKDIFSSPPPPPPLTNASDDQISENSACNHSQVNIEWQELWNDQTPIPSPTPLNYTDSRPTGTQSKRLSDNDSSETNKRRCRSCFARRAGLKMLEDKIDALAKSVTESNFKKKEVTSIEERALDYSTHTVSDSIAKLVSMPGLIHGSPEFCFACTLIEDPQKRTILHGIPDDHSRLEWIKFLFGKHRNQ